MRTRTALIGAAVAGAVVVGAMLPALAQDGTDGPLLEQQDTPDARDEVRQRHQEEFAAALAEELGLPESQVTDAIEAVHEQLRAERRAQMQEQLGERLDDAVEEGRLTQEQADAIAEAHENGVRLFGREGRGGPGGPGGHGSGGPGMHGRAMLDG
jgi:hypothetical protein